MSIRVELQVPYEIIVRREFNPNTGTLDLKFSSGVTIKGLPLQADVLQLLETDLSERAKIRTTLILEKE